MTSPAAVAAIKIVGDASDFHRFLERDLDRGLKLVNVDGKPIGRKIGEGISDATATAFAEIGRDAQRAFGRVDREAETAADAIAREIGRGGEKAEDALDEVGDRSRTEFDRVARNADQAGSTMGSSFKRAAGILYAAFAATQIVQFFSQAAQSAEDLGSAIANTGQIIKSTGGAAGLLAADVRGLSQELSLKIGVDSVEVQDAANVLLTFKGISGETFKTTMGLAADLAAVLGSDLKGAALQLGKALNDPIKGVGALARAGVQFTEQQKEQIKALIETGDLLGAQAIILEEVRTQVGGVAEAGADSTDKLAVAFLELKRVAGEALIGLVDEAAPLLLGLAQSVAPAIRSVGVSVATLIEAIMPILLPLVEIIADSLAELAPSLIPLGQAIAKIVVAAAPLLPIIVDLAAAFAVGLAAALNLVAGPLAVVVGFLEEHRGIAVLLIAAIGAWTLITNQAAIAQEILAARTAIASAATAVFTARTWSLTAAMAANPVGAFIVALGLVVAALAIAWETSDGFRGAVLGLFGAADSTNVSMRGMETSLARANRTAAEAVEIDRVLAGTMETVVQEGKELAEVWDLLHGKMASADEAALAANHAVAALAQTFRDNGHALRGNSTAALENRVAMQAAARKAAEAAQAYLNHTGDVAGAARMMTRYRDEAVKASGTTGKAREAVAAFAAQVFKLPKSAVVPVTAKVYGLDQLRTMNSMLVAALSGGGRVNVSVSGAKAPAANRQIPNFHDGGLTTQGGLANLKPTELVLPLEDHRAVSLLANALAQAQAAPTDGGVGAGTPNFDVRVYLGNVELRDLVRVEINEHNRAVRRDVTAGFGA